MDFLEGERNRRDEPADILSHSGELKKMGRQTKFWLTRYYVLQHHCLLAYQSKSDKAPKRKLSRGLTKCRHRVLEGALL